MSPEMNPEAGAFAEYDCPVIDPMDSATWCNNGPDFYPVPCKLGKAGHVTTKYIKSLKYPAL